MIFSSRILTDAGSPPEFRTRAKSSASSIVKLPAILILSPIPKFYIPDILEQLYDLYPDANIIGNCRKTCIDISELLDSEAFLKVNVSLKDRKGEPDYKNYVVGNILGDLRRFFKVEKIK
jgi:hypothetical protein